MNILFHLLFTANVAHSATGHQERIEKNDAIAGKDSTAMTKCKSISKKVNHAGVICRLYPGISYEVVARYSGDLLHIIHI